MAELKANDRADLVIVGTGLAGTVTLVQELLKIANEPSITAQSPVKITLLERYPQQKFGGVAYGKTAEFEKFRLNLTSKRATPFMADDIPAGFPAFPDYIINLANLPENKPHKDKILGYLGDPPRELFGQYLSHLVDLALAKAGDRVIVTTRIGEALELDSTGAHPKLHVRENGKMTTVEGAQVVLATGQREIQRPEFVKGIVGSPLYLEDMYSSQAKSFHEKLLAKDDGTGSVLILGTGLSGNDAALRLLQSGYKGKITMLSRNGLEHDGYGKTSVDEYLKKSLIGEPRPEKKAELEQKPPRFMRIIKAQAEEMRKGKTEDAVERDVATALQREFTVLMRRGYTSEEVLGYWERFVADMGDALPDRVCVNLYNRYATWMGTHRVGTTPENTRIMEEAKRSGQLQVVAGYIPDGGLIEEDGKVVADIALLRRVERAGPEAGPESLPRRWDSSLAKNMKVKRHTFDAVVAGLGNAVTYDKARDPFWARMIEKGMAAPHRKSGDGIELDPNDLTILDARGRRIENVTAVGIPAFGATMYGRFPHPENPGVRGGRILPFTANIVGITGGVLTMVEGLHKRLMRDRAAPELSVAAAPSSVPLSELQRGDLGEKFGDAENRKPGQKSAGVHLPVPARDLKR